MISRRGFLATSAGFALATAGRSALPDAGGRKLVVVIARGGMDGLSVTPPIGDAAYPELRGRIAVTRPLPFDRDFGLNPALVTIQALARTGQARIAPAVAIPVRDRSHFEAQDLLESGGPALYVEETGWLNRALGVGGATRLKALAAGDDMPLVIRGPIQVGTWSPAQAHAGGSRIVTILQDLYRGDPLLGDALANGLQIESEAAACLPARKKRERDAQAFGTAIGRLMTPADGPNVIGLSQQGFDTHQNQGGDAGLLFTRLQSLDNLIAGLRDGLGTDWNRTVVLVATEFGRTARVNGTGGTDHGTGSTLLLAGGALKAGGIVGDWPTLAPGKLFEDRDLAPTLDVRAVFKGVLRDHLGVDRDALDKRVFPDSARVPATAGLIA